MILDLSFLTCVKKSEYVCNNIISFGPVRWLFDFRVLGMSETVR